MHYLFPFTILLMLTSKWLYPIVFNAGFLKSANVFNIYLLLIVSRMVFPQTLLIGMRRTGILLFASATEILIAVILGLILIRPFGINGVAYASVIAFFCEKLILIGYNYIFLKINPKEYISIRPLVLYSTLLSGIFILVKFIL